MQSPIGTTLNIIHEQFIGEKTASTNADRKEYHQMKCCSLKRYLLESHYKRMSIIFYKLNGFNEPSLKHVFIASPPSELQPDLQRKLTATNLSIADISLGKIFQMAVLCLDKICEQKEFFKDLMEDKKSFSEACKKPYLRMECKDEKKCICPTRKNKHFQKHFHRKSSSKKPLRYFRKNDASQYIKKKHNRWFICKKCGHFARNCPHKSVKTVRLIQHLQHSSFLSENEDVELNFSEQSEQDDQTAFIIAESSDSDDISVISTVQTVNHVSTIPRPSLNMLILPSKFHKPVPVIGFINTGAYTSMIDPSVLLPDCWEKHLKLFRAVNGETFETTLITKKPIDDKFLIPKIQTLFVYLQGARIFSQFDLKAGFWQLGISPVDRHKTTFCIPDTHYQWTVMPFGLKEHGIMLSEKKNSIEKESIDFLGMVIKDGHYQQCPPWELAQTEAVQQLKTDASDDYWSAILLEEIYGVRHFCAHGSGQFKDSEKNYHVIYKEILAVEDFWTQDMAYEWKACPHPYTFIHDTSVTSVLKSYLMKLNNVQPPATNIYHTSVGPSHSLEIVPKTQTCTPDPPSTSAPKEMTSADEEAYLQAEAYLDHKQIGRAKRQYEKETGDRSPSLKVKSAVFLGAKSPPPLRIPTTGQRILQTDTSDDYWNTILLEEIDGVRHFCAHASGQFKNFEKNYHVIYKDTQDPWEDFQSLLHTENLKYTVTDPDPPTTSAPKEMTSADEEAYLQAEAYLDHKQIRRCCANFIELASARIYCRID
ncbi:hypothetical protein KPL70_014214 [Citrus sinensis]|nr:hypothetical protein KPL70_014214 [Citrus sinensis]